MHDIKRIRETPDFFDAAMQRRGLAALSATLLERDTALRALTTKMNDLQSRRNTASKKIGQAKAQGRDAEAAALVQEVSQLKTALQQTEEAYRENTDALNVQLMSLPNIPDADVPDGADDTENIIIRESGTPKHIDGAREHFELGEALGQMDFDAAAKLSGARFVVLKRDLARLERAIAAFMLDLHGRKFGYEEISPPVLVKSDAMIGTGQLPKFAAEAFATGEYWLTPTAEVTLTNLVRDSILSQEELPKRMVAWTQCFRSEAGAAGRDTRGLIRMHQFSKVELVSITAEENSKAEHERMTSCAEEVLKQLGLAFRTVMLCTGDLGFGAQKTYDIEVWLPGQKRFREISSCSNCGDFQARRMRARYRNGDEKKLRFVHTLNGSGLAVGRTMVALLETYQQQNGTIHIPEVLQAYMGGQKNIEKG